MRFADAQIAQGAASVSEKMPIFFIARSLELGGAERQLTALAKGLHELGHRVAVAVFYRRGPFVGELEAAGVSVIDLRKAHRWDILSFLWRAVRQVRAFRPDVVYGFAGGTDLILVAAKPFIRGAATVAGIRASNMDLSQYDWLQRFAYRLSCVFSDSADLIIANSHAGSDYSVRNGFPAAKIIVIPNGIDVDRFRPDAQLRRGQRQRFGLRDDQLAIGVLGRLDPMKGYPDFLRAAAIVARQLPRARFLCIGKGSELASLERLAEELGLRERVIFAGEQDAPAALNALDIFCSASLWGEGFSNAIAEALACGLPCVVTDVGDSAIIVGCFGKAVPASSPDSLAGAILEQAGELSNYDGKAARDRITQEFSVEAMISRTQAALQGLCSR